MITGVDISKYQPNFAPRAKDSFVVVKASEGSTVRNAYHDAQVARARAAGKIAGHYHWLHKGNIADQVANFAREAKVQQGDIIALDWEEPSPLVPVADEVAWVKAARARFPNNRIVVYTFPYYQPFRDSYRQADWADGLWIADYRSGTTPRDIFNLPWLIHQYTTNDGTLDENRARFDTQAAMHAWTRGLEDDIAAKVPFRGGWTCSCVATSLPWVEQDMIRRGIIRESIDIAQLGWRTSTEASKGTHAEGGCVDTWGQWNTAAIDVWRRWGWTMQRRDLSGINTHAHGWPYGCTHLAPAAQAQARDWDRKDAGLQGSAQVIGRWPVKHWKTAMEDGIMSMIDDIAEAAADKVLARRGEIADALITRGLKLSDKAEDAIAVRVRDRVFNDKVIPTYHRPPEGGWPAGAEPGKWTLHALLRSIRVEIGDIEKKVDALTAEATPADEQE